MLGNTEKIAALFVAVAALAGCGESDQDKARKGGLIDRVVSNSLDRCDTGQQVFTDTDASYETRLRTILADVRSDSMDLLLRQDITVCLDQRLYDLEAGFFNNETFGIYYKPERVVTVWDNGLNNGRRAFIGSSNRSWDDDVIDELADGIRDGDKDLSENLAVANVHSTGKSWWLAWDKASDVSNIPEKNPQIAAPPLAPR